MHTRVVDQLAAQSSQNVAGMKRRNSYIQNVIGHTAVTTRFQDSRTVMQEKFVPPQTSMATYFMTKVLLIYFMLAVSIYNNSACRCVSQLPVIFGCTLNFCVSHGFVL